MSNENSCSWYDIPCQCRWLSAELKSFWIYVYDSLMDGLAAMVETIPVPDLLSNLQTVHLPASVSWFLEPFNLPSGLLIIVGAYTARFVLRRIPFIG